MAFDVLPYVIGKGYTNQVALGIGNMRVEGTTVYFTIVETGEEIGVTLPTPADGVSVVDINLNDNHELTFFMSDGTEIVAGQIEAIKGNKGDKGDKGDAGENGVDGKDGFSPTVSVTEIDGGHKVNITDKSGTKSFDILNGEKGDKGDKGDTGANGTNGLKGEDGYTPVKGTDYWTDDDKTEIVNEVSSKTYLKSEIDIKFNSVNDDISANTEAINANKTDILSVSKKATTLENNLGGHTVGVDVPANAVFTDTVYDDSEIKSDILAVDDKIEDLKAQGVQQTPLFADSVEWLEENGDTSKVYVLPDGYIYGYIKTTIITEGESIPNFTNLLDNPNAYTKDNQRYSLSSNAWKDETGGTSYIIPIPKGTVTLRIKNYHYHGYQYIYAGTTNTKFEQALGDTSAGSAFLAALSKQDEEIAVTFTNDACDYATFFSKTGYVEIVTANEEITYTTTEGGTVTTYEWANTGHKFIVVNKSETVETAFSIPAYCPTPQLPADGTEGSDFDYKSTTTQDAYDYMDALCGKYTQYITKQTMGKDASGNFDHNRYILSKPYWRAWQRENYPKMFAWINGSTVIYSVSVSPRVGDTMYTTPYVGTAYNTVTSVNSAAATASTRTVNGLVFTRYTDGDVEPTVVYTKPPQYPGATLTVRNLSDVSVTTVSTMGNGYFIGADGIKYIRYPFEDMREDKSKPLSIFVLSNEHGNYGDDLIPSFVVMRMAKDLCRNTENPFIKWLKENCIITMIPVGNPWGYARYLVSGNTSGYCNSNAVNINRNYDTPGWETSNTDPQGGTKEDGAFGAYPGSEIETQHIMNTMQLCKPAVGISMHSPGFAQQYKDMADNAYFIHQGQGYDPERIHKITEVLYSNYGMGGSADVGSAQHYENCGKSPAYIQYVGAVGGLTETVTQENGTNNIYTSIAMEQAYTQMLLFLQTWCEEALQKNN